jgi:hypothetical protein
VKPMSRVWAVVVMIGVGAFPFLTSGCAGELTDAQRETREGGLTTGGSGGGGSGGGGSGGSGGGATGGSAGAGGSTGGGAGNPETCMLAMSKQKNCGLVGCHAGANAAAELLMTEDALRQARDLFVDKLNKGRVPGCMPGTHKLIDKAQPEKSLLYTKLTAQFPCGDRMPSGDTVNDAELSCVLAWIKSVAGVP